MTDLELFHVDDPRPVEKLSPDRRRTARQKADVDAGIHPLMGGKTRPDLGTCGGCKHRQLYLTNGNRSWPKCNRYGVTHGPGTDCRAWWPACSLYEPKEPR